MIRKLGLGLMVAWLVWLGECMGGNVQGRTFHVDSENGQDQNTGVTSNTAWRSLDRVNGAELKPGDTVRFRCGGVWRGSLTPVSGDEEGPVTYASYGKGPKPAILGSRPRDGVGDWVEIDENVWATLPLEFRQDELVLDLRGSKWGRHQEAGADVAVAEELAPQGRITTFTCKNSGQATNHVQVSGPRVAVKKGACLQMTFRARSSKPFRLRNVLIRQSGAPWTAFATAHAMDREIGAEWEEFKMAFDVAESAEAGGIVMYLGGILPTGAVFDFQPQSLHLATASIADPLAVDVGNIIFDHGKVCGWKKWSVAELEKPYDYYYDGSSWRVFLRLEANPATLHQSIECAMKRHVINQGNAHHVIYDGLAVKYGAAHGFGGGNTHDLVIRNCDLSYIGGGHQLTRPGGRPVRYGNAIEFWGAARDNLVENCRIWEVYDAALTNQGSDPSSKQVNITYRDNLIWNAEYSFEYWNHPEAAITRNIRFVNNTCINAGTVWSHAQRPDRNGSHLMFYSNTADTSGIEIKYNVFYNATEWGSRYSSGWKTLPEMDYNVWYSRDGVTVNWFGEKIGPFDEYQKTTGLDGHSRFADPRFVDSAGGDYRLAPESPARGMRTNGGAVGATWLWNDGD